MILDCTRKLIPYRTIEQRITKPVPLAIPLNILGPYHHLRCPHQTHAITVPPALLAKVKQQCKCCVPLHSFRASGPREVRVVELRPSSLHRQPEMERVQSPLRCYVCMYLCMYGHVAPLVIHGPGPRDWGCSATSPLAVLGDTRLSEAMEPICSFALSLVLVYERQ